jgi:hypothetical protein
MPESHSVVQTGKDILYAGPCAAVFPPAKRNSPPQFIAESEPFRPLRFLWSNSLRDRMYDKCVRLEFEVWAVSAQDLGYHQLTVGETDVFLMRIPTS